jgi:hypothetical protein
MTKRILNMEEVPITCPKCGHEFELSDALTGRIREHLKAELLKDIKRREANVKKELESLEVEREKIQKSREAIEQEVEEKLKDRVAEIEEKAKKRLEDKYVEQLEELQGEVEDKEKEIKSFRKQELELRKRQRELQEAKESYELEVARKLDEERTKLKEDAFKKAAEDHRLKDLEKDKMINDLRTSLEDMKRKTEQGSMETQGEVLEQDFEEQLKSFFLHDIIQPVPKGIRGADLVQCVKTPLGAECGILLWETKNTKAWSHQWIPKLKDDMIETRATIAILVSVVLPENLGRFGQIDGVWVSDPLSAIPLAVALRESLIAVNRERKASTGKNEKMEALYNYLAGVEFKQKIEGTVEAFTAMREQIDRERRTMERHWKQREKELERVIKNTAGLYGDMQGIIGGQIPEIPALDFDADDVKHLPDISEDNSNYD